MKLTERFASKTNNETRLKLRRVYLAVLIIGGFAFDTTTGAKPGVVEISTAESAFHKVNLECVNMGFKSLGGFGHVSFLFVHKVAVPSGNKPDIAVFLADL